MIALITKRLDSVSKWYKHEMNLPRGLVGGALAYYPKGRRFEFRHGLFFILPAMNIYSE